MCVCVCVSARAQHMHMHTPAGQPGVCVCVCSVRTHAHPPARCVRVCVCVRAAGLSLTHAGQGAPSQRPSAGCAPSSFYRNRDSARAPPAEPGCEHAQWKPLVWPGSRFPVSGMRDSEDIPMS